MSPRTQSQTSDVLRLGLRLEISHRLVNHIANVSHFRVNSDRAAVFEQLLHQVIQAPNFGVDDIQEWARLRGLRVCAPARSAWS